MISWHHRWTALAFPEVHPLPERPTGPRRSRPEWNQRNSCSMSLERLNCEQQCTVPLNTAQLLVALLGELGLHADHRFKAGIEVRDPQIHQLGKLCNKLVVQQIEDFFRLIVLLLGLQIRVSIVQVIDVIDPLWEAS